MKRQGTVPSLMELNRSLWSSLFFAADDGSAGSGSADSGSAEGGVVEAKDTGEDIDVNLIGAGGGAVEALRSSTSPGRDGDSPGVAASDDPGLGEAGGDAIIGGAPDMVAAGGAVPGDLAAGATASASGVASVDAGGPGAESSMGSAGTGGTSMTEGEDLAESGGQSAATGAGGLAGVAVSSGSGRERGAETGGG